MPRPKQTYGKRAAELFTEFLVPSSPQKQAVLPSSPLSSPPASALRRSARQKRIICSDDEDEDEDCEECQAAGSDSEALTKPSELASGLSSSQLIEDSDDEPDDELSMISIPAENTRSRAPLQPRNTNAVPSSTLIPPGAATLKAVVIPVEHQRERVIKNENDALPSSPAARRQRNILHRKQRTSPSLMTSPYISKAKPKATPTPSPFKSPSFATRPHSPSLTFSVRPQKQKNEISALPLPDPQDEYTAPLLRLVSDPTGREKPTSFQAWSNDISQYFGITKLAEASYGEVYRLSLIPGKSGKQTLKKAEESVLKLIALKPPPEAQSKMSKKEKEKVSGMSKVEDVAGEVKLLQRMTPVPGFTNFREVRVTQGRLPSQFIKAWHVYDREVRRSEFPDPSLPSTYSEDQLWAVIEMQDAGKDLEPEEDTGESKINTVFAVWDAFWSVACAVSKGEEWARFEHRDLHLGNVCVKSGNGHWGDWDNWPTTDKLDRKLDFTGLETTIIDYTLSRADMERVPDVGDETSFVAESPTRTRQRISPLDLYAPSGSTASPSEGLDASSLESSISKEDSVAFLNLSLDQCLFEGDASEEYQYEIYRFMRNAVLAGLPTLEPRSPNSAKGRKTKAQIAFEVEQAEHERLVWREHHPMTNLIWLHFVLYKLCAGVAEWPSELDINDKESDGGKRAVHKRGYELENMLNTLEGLLEIENLAYMMENDGIRSARELVAWAVGEGWLDESDVMACGMPETKTGKKEKKTRTRRQPAKTKKTTEIDNLVGGIEGVKLA